MDPLKFTYSINMESSHSQKCPKVFKTHKYLVTPLFICLPSRNERQFTRSRKRQSINIWREGRVLRLHSPHNAVLWERKNRPKQTGQGERATQSRSLAGFLRRAMMRTDCGNSAAVISLSPVRDRWWMHLWLIISRRMQVCRRRQTHVVWMTNHTRWWFNLQSQF
jgi:hypothetical protein